MNLRSLVAGATGRHSAGNDCFGEVRGALHMFGRAQRAHPSLYLVSQIGMYATYKELVVWVRPLRLHKVFSALFFVRM